MEPGQLESIHHHNSDAAKLGGGRQAAGREERHQHINTPSNVTDALFRHSFKPPPHTHTHTHRQTDMRTWIQSDAKCINHLCSSCSFMSYNENVQKAVLLNM